MNYKINRNFVWVVSTALLALVVIAGTPARAEDQITTAVMTIDITPSGGGSCIPGMGSMAVEKGQTVELEAIPAPGYSFIGWSWEGDGNPMDPLSAQTSIYIIGDISLTARFEPK